MNAAVSDFGAAVAAGFTVSTTGGEALLRAIEMINFDLDRAAQATGRLTQEPPLGTTPAAQVYKPFLATIASDPVQGLEAALKQFRSDLDRLGEQVQEAMKLYDTEDQDVAKSVTDTGGSTLST
ncbi:hypothetical protein [Saccharothrix sp. HUAS TT1]|uniref:hypothetical protein n=1 Tax=unclassified Saccharothrix TaxID=2593673 RepID=UPI00345BDE6E